MSSQDPTSTPRPPMEPERRGSWWRRVTNKMKRRSSGMATPRSGTPTAATPSATAHGRTTATRAITPPALHTQTILERGDAAAISEHAPVASSTPMAPTPAVEPAGLVAAETDDEGEESLLPMLSSRTGITSDRARDLFAKYGMEYGARNKQSTSEPPSKIRRVEKPVRLRVHWTCHECSRQFGMEKTCHSCGHRRCRDCTRHPPRRIREALENTRREIEQQEGTSAQGNATAAVPAVDLDLQQYQQEPSRPVTEQPGPAPAVEESDPKEALRTQEVQPVSRNLQAFPLELDNDADDEEVGLPDFEFSIYARPRAGVSAVLKPKTQIIRRSCHKCGTDFVPPGRKHCSSCGHDLCDLCPKVNKKLPQDEEPPMIQAVRRVYRKPRQRVRWTCERCNTLFVDSDLCFECGHERCSNCTREPPKRSSHQHDPAVIQAVADRLATYGGAISPLGITASAG